MHKIKSCFPAKMRCHFFGYIFAECLAKAISLYIAIGLFYDFLLNGNDFFNLKSLMIRADPVTGNVSIKKKL